MNEKIDRIVLSLKEEIFREASNLVKIRSVQTEAAPGKPFGEGVAQALEYTLRLGERLGFRVKNVDGYAGHIEYGDGERLFAVLGHLDVVPEGEGWSVDPYGGIIKDGYLWGRGASDNKGPTVAVIYALKAVKEAGVKIKNRVRIILGTDEESGWECVKYYFRKEEKPIYAVTPDAAFPIIYAEKGIITYRLRFKSSASTSLNLLKLEGGDAPNVVPQTAVAELSPVSNELVKKLEDFHPKNGAKMSWRVEDDRLLVRAQGKSAHGSTPERGINAIAALLDFLRDLPLDEGTKIFVGSIAGRIGYETDGTSLRIAGSDCITGPLTVNLGTIKMQNDSLEATINIRYPVYYSETMLTRQVKEALKPIQVEEEHHLPPLFVSPDSELIKILSEVYMEVTNQPVKLLTMGGGTYARAVPCGVAFGPLLPGREGTEHQPDERIALEDLVTVARIYAQLFYRMLALWGDER
ncbi:dipeptidase PepV [Pseudothermotoga sp.]|nr:dipeptidase PepV [Pseudothermotoga sp.]MCX7813230.1 dipeptidase PepV [Pseudothermotoga sp.]MDW8140335.1 dipeptidase PepV [Pseudothermotoga sp.]